MQDQNKLPNTLLTDDDVQKLVVEVEHTERRLKEHEDAINAHTMGVMNCKEKIAHLNKVIDHYEAEAEPPGDA
jgi:hypothetical protein